MRTRKKKERIKMKTGEKKKLEFVENLIEHLDHEECKVTVLLGIISAQKDQLAIERSERLKCEAIIEGLKIEMDSICGGEFNHGA